MSDKLQFVAFADAAFERPRQTEVCRTFSQEDHSRPHGGFHNQSDP